jgi:hypothetical protein
VRNLPRHYHRHRMLIAVGEICDGIVGLVTLGSKRLGWSFTLARLVARREERSARAQTAKSQTGGTGDR